MWADVATPCQLLQAREVDIHMSVSFDRVENLARGLSLVHTIRVVRSTWVYTLVDYAVERVGSGGFVKPVTPSDGEPTTVTEPVAVYSRTVQYTNG